MSFWEQRKGQSILFHEEDVRDMGRTARGVIGIRMDDDDAVVGMEMPSEGNSIITVSENGYGKRTESGRIPAAKPRRPRGYKSQNGFQGRKCFRGHSGYGR